MFVILPAKRVAHLAFKAFFDDQPGRQADQLAFRVLNSCPVLNQGLQGFTIPPTAAVGLTEAEVREKDLRFRMKSERAESWFTARQAEEKVYGFKVLVDEETDLVLGTHQVGPHADEVINLFALAIRQGLTAEQMKTTMLAYPSGALDIGYML